MDWTGTALTGGTMMALTGVLIGEASAATGGTALTGATAAATGVTISTGATAATTG